MFCSFKKFCFIAIASLCASIPVFADNVIVAVAGIPGTPRAGSTSLQTIVGNDGFIASGFSFTLAQSYSDISVTTLWTPEFSGDITAFLTNSVGPGTTSANVLGTSSSDLASLGPVTVSTQVTLDPGTYDVLYLPAEVFVFDSLPLAQSFTLTTNGASLGQALFCVKCTSLAPGGFPPSGTWVNTGESLATPLLITGTPVPEPSAYLLLLVGLLVVLWKRLS